MGKIISLVILYEIYDIKRSPRIYDFASYAHLVKCVPSVSLRAFNFGG
ncbi:MAG: hypothetical protein GXP56_01345 [Deltaproteobacteria bacterium]|nr:hypothetical protein [Deltaproteobacteria bacterium]